MSQQRLPATENDVRPPSEFDSHEIRITQGGKIRAWVDFALKFFEVSRSIVAMMNSFHCFIGAQENEEKALVLHTLPAVNKSGSVMSGQSGVDAGDNDDTQANDTVTKNKKGLSPSTTTIPRLISVAEIIKREYLLAMDVRRMPDLMGLYQYNEIGCVENGVEADKTGEGAEDRLKTLAEALEGKK